MHLLIIFLPLLSFLTIICFGDWLGPRKAIFFSLFYISCAFLMMLVNFIIYYGTQYIIYIDLFSWIELYTFKIQ